MPIRIGVLGAAKIVPMALTNPANSVPEVQIAAIAARDRSRAEAAASKLGIPRVFSSYADLIADPQIDAIYNPLPNSLHCEWTIRALEAGKHVLCEKPIASNAAEAEQMRDAAKRTGRVLMEAFHWRYHPLAQRAIEILRSGQIGLITRYEAFICFPIFSGSDIRYQYKLAGGAMMDAGCYAVSMVRHLSGEEPTVMSAKALLRFPNVDRRMDAELTFRGGATGGLTVSMLSSAVLNISVRVTGESGFLRIWNPLIPQLWNRLTVTAGGKKTHERVAGEATYTYQLRAFAKAINDRAPLITGPDDAVGNMRVIDSVYQHAGLPLRGM